MTRASTMEREINAMRAVSSGNATPDDCDAVDRLLADIAAIPEPQTADIPIVMGGQGRGNIDPHEVAVMTTRGTFVLALVAVALIVVVVAIGGAM